MRDECETYLAELHLSFRKESSKILDTYLADPKNKHWLSRYMYKDTDYEFEFRVDSIGSIRIGECDYDHPNDLYSRWEFPILSKDLDRPIDEIKQLLAKEFTSQLEFQKSYNEALQMKESAQIANKELAQLKALKEKYENQKD
jgi:hypothetical protein